MATQKAKKPLLLFTSLTCPLSMLRLNTKVYTLYFSIPYGMFTDLKTLEYLKKNPNGKVPLLETVNNKFIFESNAILRYIARLDKSRGLYGRDDEEAGLVDQWLDWFSTNYERDFYRAIGHHTGRGLQLSKKEVKESSDIILAAFKVLDNHLKLNSFLVGNRLTIADISISVTLRPAFQYIWDEKFRKNIPNITRWYEYLINQEPFKKVFGRPILCKKSLVALNPQEKVAESTATETAEKSDKGKKGDKK